jgi:crotonobetainyl-CoA:carnitine CoA-transferase CaiB-like acyl-CoA transferase
VTALADIRVVELSDVFTGIGGRLLAELGADVVVVEPPGGSPQRRRPPFVDDEPDPDRSLRWWSANVGKRSVTLDVRSEAGVLELRRLIDGADVVIEGAGRGLDELGLGYDPSTSADALIWVSVTPFGRESARRDDPVTDLTVLSGGGPVWNCGYDDHSIPPMRGAGDQAVNLAGLYAAMATLVAVAHRDRTGRGQLVDVNVTAACNVSSEQATYSWLVARQICERQTGRHAGPWRSSRVQVECADGAYATTGVLPRTPAELGRLHAWLEELGLVEDFPEAVFLEMGAQRNAPLELANIGTDDETTAIFAAARNAMAVLAAVLPAKEFFLQSQRKGLPTGAILSPEEAFDDEHLAARGFRVPVAHPELGQTFEYPGMPYLFSTSPGRAPRRPPLVGEHNQEVLSRADPGRPS